MLRNYLKMAWRSFVLNKAFSVINIVGLTIGLACSLMILLWVWDELSIDNFHKNGDRLYVVYERQTISGKVYAGYNTPGLLAAELKRTIPEIEYASAFAWIKDTPDRLVFRAGDKMLKFDGYYADSDYFRMMSYPLLKGSPATALNGPGTLCISNKMATAFFGSAAAALGKTIRYDNRKEMTVTGVFDDLQGNVSAKFDFLINWSDFLDDNKWAKDWGNTGPNTIVMLRKDANLERVEAKVRKALEKYSAPGYRLELGMQRFGDSYLHANFSDEDGYVSGGRIEYVRLFIILAVFILLIACINFMNLTTARSVKRGKEIGVRKVSGALRSSLITQFLSEAMILTGVSVVLALLIGILALPYFNVVTGKQVVFPFANIYFWIGLIGLTVITGLAAGSYPALFLSSFKPISVLKGTLKFSGNATLFRRGLVVFQFVLSVIVIIGTIIVSKQVNYIQHINLGYDRENLVYIPVEGNLLSKYNVFKQAALNAPGIKMVSRIGESPTSVTSGTTGVQWAGKQPDNSPVFTNTPVGYDFVKTMNLKLVAGRDHSKDFATDSAGYLINESALKIIGYKDPVGKPLTFWGKKGTIIGVLKDFHFASLHDPIRPLILRFGENEDWGNILVRTEAGKTKTAMASLERICKELNPNVPFTCYFADEEYQKLYVSEGIVGKLSGWFSFLCIFVSCLGLLGLAMFTAEQRVKEIGIRKVLGASLALLFTLLSKEFILLIFIALVIASPLAWMIMDKWLQHFAYKIDIEWWMFALAGLLVVLVGILTVSYQGIKAVLVNPVESLRAE